LLPIDKVEELCAQARSAGTMQIANLLCPGNTVVSGTKAACDEIENLAAAAGAKTVRLSVAGAFHTDIMKPADQTLSAKLDQTTLHAARIPVWSNVDARPHTEPAEIRGLLVRQVLQPVQWETTLRGLLAQGVEKFYEIGPQRVLAGLLKRVDRKIECVNIQA
ncbi:MAG: [acyl-carrier-protein] S-malonyltransferase, partial [Planctomycetes bacterium]|nr:[acyl-carrier-protein] S-malonyltransferase [Planctomycetota bacterium]